MKRIGVTSRAGSCRKEPSVHGHGCGVGSDAGRVARRAPDRGGRARTAPGPVGDVPRERRPPPFVTQSPLHRVPPMQECPLSALCRVSVEKHACSTSRDPHSASDEHLTADPPPSRSRAEAFATHPARVGGGACRRSVSSPAWRDPPGGILRAARPPRYAGHGFDGPSHRCGFLRDARAFGKARGPIGDVPRERRPPA